MTINDVMKIATEGMNTAQRQEEKERRIKTVERLNKLDEKVKRINIHLKLLPAECDCCKIWRNRRNSYNREIRKIKANESAWLKEVAWFIY